ncbi:hypothetical protein [Pelagibius sp.]|uniref:hypothetical protein n=1 Tax=Pelagibius sp. TaxID=1931238 RepID=UPI002624954F|nr:hypothetical protein [Pelagibius sp.]
MVRLTEALCAFWVHRSLDPTVYDFSPERIWTGLSKLIFMSLMLHVEVRIMPTYEVATNALVRFVWLGETLVLEGCATPKGQKDPRGALQE